MTDLGAALDRHGCGYVEIDAAGHLAKPNQILLKWFGNQPPVAWADALTPGAAVYWMTNVEPLLISQGFARDVAVELRGPKALPILVFASHQDEVTTCVIIPYIQRQIYERALAASERDAALQQAEIDRLQALDKFRADFLNSLSHEIATPITPLKLRVAALSAKLETREVDVAKQLSGINSSIAKIEHLFSTLMAAAQAQTEALLSPATAINVDEFVRETFSNWQAKNSSHQVMEISTTPGTAVADSAGLAACLHQVLDNAHKFAGPGATITVKVSPEAIDIEDNGPGIPAEKLSRIGRPFVKAHDEDQVTTLGAGLGLFITRRIMENMGGKMFIKSSAGGTTVRLQLPEPELDG